MQNLKKVYIVKKNVFTYYGVTLWCCIVKYDVTEICDKMIDVGANASSFNNTMVNMELDDTLECPHVSRNDEYALERTSFFLEGNDFHMI